MGCHFCCLKQKLRKGLWSPEEDEKLFNYITRFRVGYWSSVPKQAGLQRCGKSCRLRWINYLRPDLKRGMFSQQEEDLIFSLHEVLGNRWAQIAAQLPGRTDNEIKNFWNSCLKKKMIKQGIDPSTHKPLIKVEVKEEKICQEIESAKISTPSSLVSSAGFLVSDSDHFNGGQTEGLRESYVSKHPSDSLSFVEFQLGIDPSASSSRQSSLKPFCNFNGVPSVQSLTSSTDISDNSVSKVSNYGGLQMNNMESAGFSWHNENKLDFLLQFYLNGVKAEEMKPVSWEDLKLQTQDFINFIGNPSTSLSQDLSGRTFDLFHQLYLFLMNFPSAQILV